MDQITPRGGGGGVGRGELVGRSTRSVGRNERVVMVRLQRVRSMLLFRARLRRVPPMSDRLDLNDQTRLVSVWQTQYEYSYRRLTLTSNVRRILDTSAGVYE